MQREYVRWSSPSLGRDMELLVHGHSGTPVLVFPTSMGRFFEWEDFGMVGALGEQLEHGHNTLFCIDSVDAETFYNHAASVQSRMARHGQFERYVLEEVLPFIHARAATPFLIVAGASFGAYHAANIAFRHPGSFGKVIAMGGKYDIAPFLDGGWDDAVFFNNPPHYLPGLVEPGLLDALRRLDVRLLTGDGDFCARSTGELAAMLWSKGVGCTLDVWQGAGHDWPWWRGMIKKHIV